MTSIPLSRGLSCTVDADDAALFGKVKWSASSHAGRHAYAYRTERGRRIYLHRLIVGARPGEVVDHVNGDTLDNRRANLRITDRCTNAQNLHSRVRASSGARNVLKHPRGFLVRIWRNGERHYGGVFRSVEEAVAARDRLATLLARAA